MGRPNYYSAFAEHISKFLDYRENSGIKYMYPDYVHLKNLDNFLSKKELRTSLFPEIKPSNGNNNLRMNQKAHNMTELI